MLTGKGQGYLQCQLIPGRPTYSEHRLTVQTVNLAWVGTGPKGFPRRIEFRESAAKHWSPMDESTWHEHVEFVEHVDPESARLFGARRPGVLPLQ